VRPTRRLATASRMLMRVALAERAQPARDAALGVVSRLQRSGGRSAEPVGSGAR
jgi:hypothetical protein